jgi:hypothetical protein
VVPAGAASPQPKLKDVLKQAAAYVRQFETDFAAVITDETYVQDDRVKGDPWDVRHIRSEMLFVRLPGQGLAWISARNVLEVDGTPVADSHDRLERAIKGDAAGLAERLLSVADEGARFNIGRIERNFNDPILPLLFLDSEYQPRFKFRLEEDEDVNGVRASKIAFRETGRPTVIRETGGRNLDMAGAVWVRLDGDAVVVRTEISARSSRMSFTIRVDYRRDDKLDMWIPSRMEERYKYPNADEQIDCIAEYSNARRFETSGRIIAR